nr:hypothetical protein KJK04_p0255 [Klebsiella quasipneumoniae]
MAASPPSAPERRNPGAGGFDKYSCAVSVNEMHYRRKS